MSSRHRAGVSKFAVLIVAAVCLIGCGDDEPCPVPLDLEDSRLPYDVVWTRNLMSGLMNWGFSRSSEFIDLDGDGVDETIANNNPYVRVDWHRDSPNFTIEQFNLPGRFTGRQPCAWIDGAWDLDGDGVKEVVFGSRTPDGSEIRYWILDARTHRAALTFTLPVGEDLYEDGIWDGAYTAVGVLDVPTAEGPVRALVLICQVRYDEYGRGVFAVDLRDGSLLWSRPLANVPDREGTVLVDVDENGTPEILVLGKAPNNLDEEDGDHVDGLRDDRTRLICLGADGALRWRRDLDTGASHMSSLMIDLDGDGEDEWLVGSALPKEGNSLRRVDPATGEVLETLPTHDIMYRLVAHRNVRDGAAVALSFDRSGGLREFRMREGALVEREVARADMKTPIHASVDLLPEPGREIVCTDTKGRVIVLSAGYDLLAVGEPFTRIVGKSLRTVRSREGFLRLVFLRNDDLGFFVQIEPRDRPFRWPPVGFAVGVLGAGLSAFVVLRRKRGGVDTMSIQDRRLALLERLEVAGHGQIGALRTLRRLVVKVMFAASGNDDTATARRAGELRERLKDETLPRLKTTIELAVACELPDHRIARSRAALDDLEALLAGGRGAAGDGTLRTAADEIEGAFQMLRREVLACFETPLDAALEAVREGVAEAFAEAGVELRAAGPPGVTVRCAAEDLEYVLDNLCMNALSALGGSPRREVRLDWTADEGVLDLRASDTGCGIATDDWEAVFEFGISSRKGGGEGLPRSRRKLRRFGGSLVILESAPGRGTVFRMRLPTAPSA